MRELLIQRQRMAKLSQVNNATAIALQDKIVRKHQRALNAHQKSLVYKSQSLQETAGSTSPAVQTGRTDANGSQG